MNEVNVLPDFEVVDWGLIRYQDALGLQRECVQKVIEGHPGMLIFCEHPTVLTLGRMAREENILLDRQKIHKQSVDIVDIDRGGDITLHAPGQLVIYPIFNLSGFCKDLHLYLNRLEQASIDFLKEFGIVAQRFPTRTGVWLGNKKIVSIGIGVKKWVSYHGIGINVNTDLKLFSMIRPCGFDVGMASIESIQGRPADMEAAKKYFVECFSKVFGK